MMVFQSAANSCCHENLRHQFIFEILQFLFRGRAGMYILQLTKQSLSTPQFRAFVVESVQ